METELTLKQLLLENYLKWQETLGERKTQKEYAEDVLDIHEVTFSRYFNQQRQPSKAILVQFATKTGDPRFYDLAGAPRPDPQLLYVQSSWNWLSDEAKQKVRDVIERFMTKGTNSSD